MIKLGKTQEKGITLIALVITIIVMLILVAVTINLAINGKLFDYARTAVTDTQEAANNEREGRITIDGVSYSSLQAYRESLNCNHDWEDVEIIKEATCTESGEKTVHCLNCDAIKNIEIPKTNHVYASNSAWEIIPEEGKEKNTCTICGNEIKRYIVGARINGYDPTNNNTITTSYTSLGSYDSETQGEFGDGTTGNGKENQKVILTRVIWWKVLGEENGQIIITTGEAVKAETQNMALGFRGESGYAHYKEELDKCCSIYGQGQYADTTKFALAKDVTNGSGELERQEIIANASGARSINVADLERIGYKTSKRTYTFRKDATDNKIYCDGYTGSLWYGRTEIFDYWTGDVESSSKPYTWKRLQAGESVTLSYISGISGTTTARAKDCLFGESGKRTSYLIPEGSMRMNTDSDGDLKNDRIEYRVRHISGGFQSVDGSRLSVWFRRNCTNRDWPGYTPSSIFSTRYKLNL